MGTARIASAQVGEGLSEHELVRRARRGDDRAFELLYARYQRRITAFVLGLVKDHGRAEDITQEVFVSALRRMRATERPIAFKPWIYEIARNACIDAYRRGRRGEEISFDADDRLSPADRGRLVASQGDPPDAVAAKEELDTMLGAFDGLSDAHHQILVMRELEGLSYADIAERLGMSRGGVESTLFRARKRLGEEYDDLASGARCVRVQGIIAANEGDSLGARDARRLARHVSHCQPCRRLALQAGLDVPARRGLRGRIAAWLPLPGSLRLGGWGTQRIAEALEPGWGKLAAGAAALLLAGAGTDAVVNSGAAGDAPRPAAVAPDAGTPAGSRPADAGAPTASSGRTTPAAARDGDGRSGTAGAVRERERGEPERGGAGALGPGGGDAGGAGGGGGSGDGDGSGASGGDGSGGGSGGGSSGGSAGGGTDAGSGAGSAGGGPLPALTPVTDGVTETVQTAPETVQDTVQDVTQTVDETVDDVQQVVEDPGGAVPQVGSTVEGAVDGAADTVDGVVDGASGTVDGVLSP